MSVEGWGCPRVNINMAELRSQGNGGLSQRLRRDPLPHLRALEAACHEIAMESRPGYDKNGMLKNLVDIYFFFAFFCFLLIVPSFVTILRILY